MNYFENVTTMEDAKKVYKKYLFLLHPDTSGYDSQKDFIEFIKQWDKLSIDGFSTQDKKDFYNVAKDLESLPSHINIDFVGSFIWLTNTNRDDAQHIKAIKLDGFKGPFWAKNKLAWYYSPQDYKKKSGKHFELSEIKTKYGHVRIKPKGVYSLTH
jgi:hypothetical protein